MYSQKDEADGTEQGVAEANCAGSKRWKNPLTLSRGVSGSFLTLGSIYEHYTEKNQKSNAQNTDRETGYRWYITGRINRCFI